MSYDASCLYRKLKEDYKHSLSYYYLGNLKNNFIQLPTFFGCRNAVYAELKYPFVTLVRY